MKTFFIACILILSDTVYGNHGRKVKWVNPQRIYRDNLRGDQSNVGECKALRDENVKMGSKDLIPLVQKSHEDTLIVPFVEEKISELVDCDIQLQESLYPSEKPVTEEWNIYNFLQVIRNEEEGDITFLGGKISVRIVSRHDWLLLDMASIRGRVAINVGDIFNDPNVMCEDDILESFYASDNFRNLIEEEVYNEYSMAIVTETYKTKNKTKLIINVEGSEAKLQFEFETKSEVEIFDERASEDGALINVTIQVCGRADAYDGTIERAWPCDQTERVVVGSYGGNEKVINIDRQIGKRRHDLSVERFKVGRNDTDATVCTTENEYVRVVNAHHPASAWNGDNGLDGSQKMGEVFDCDHPDMGDEENGGYSPTADVMYYGTKFYEMFLEWYGIKPIPYRITIYSHGFRDVNAYFSEASPGKPVCVFGDGNEDESHPLTNADVVAHEIAHGVTHFSSGLVYESYSGGLNEAFSDISGQALMYYLTGRIDLKMGAKFYKESGSFMRNMANPEADGHSIGDARDMTEYTEVHSSSGVMNKAFAILVNRTGWTPRQAYNIFVEANMAYWREDSDFNSAGCDLVAAANDYCYSTSDVRIALAGVGITMEGTECVRTVHPTHNYRNTIQGPAKDENYFIPIPNGSVKMILVLVKSFTQTNTTGFCRVCIRYEQDRHDGQCGEPTSYKHTSEKHVLLKYPIRQQNEKYDVSHYYVTIHSIMGTQMDYSVKILFTGAENEDEQDRELRSVLSSDENVEIRSILSDEETSSDKRLLRATRGWWNHGKK